uniref:Uncharacterized protein n=1 Tax=Arundo donax TaxID=35708 RepID=A0A0A9F2Q0_ARUDO
MRGCSSSDGARRRTSGSCSGGGRT